LIATEKEQKRLKAYEILIKDIGEMNMRLVDEEKQPCRIKP
jgi:hypothetical protein